MRTFWQVGLVVGMVACAPLTAVRQTTRVGHTAPQPWTGSVAESGQAWAGGSLEAGTSAAQNLGQRAPIGGSAAKGDPGLLISRLRGSLHGRVGVGDHVELGGRASLDHSGTEVATRAGVLPNDEGPSYAFAPTMALRVPVSHAFDLVTRGEGRVSFIPYSRYRLVEEDVPDGIVIGDGSQYYELSRSGVVRRMLWSGSFSLVWREPKRNGDLHVGVAITEVITNNGFSETVAEPAERGVPAAMLVMGGAAQIGDLRIGGQGWVRPYDGNDHGAAAPLVGASLLIEGRIAKPEFADEE